MKNLQYFPFERNRYYYGKLLTEQDFNSEQRYFNDKRRMANRFLHGTGVVAGLQVVGIDEKSISLEAGIALDGAGRELVAERPVVLRLEQIDGFEQIAKKGNQDFVYLCMEYEEKEAMPSHNVTSAASLDSGSMEFDKIKEGYHLYLTDTPLKNEEDTLDFLFRRRSVLFENEDICLLQEYPQFVKSGEKFQISLIIENRGRARECSLELEEALVCASFEGLDRLTVREQNRLESRDSIKRYEYTMQAFPVEMGDVELHVIPDQFTFKTGGELLRLESETVFKIPVVTGDTLSVLKERHFRNAMDQVLKNAYPPGIYLAKIYLIQAGQVYMIDRIEPMPFCQYVYSPFLTMGMLEALVKERRPEAGRPREPLGVSEQKAAVQKERCAEGTVEIELGIGGKRGQKFFSHEIVHGLGLGRISISLSLEQEDGMLFGSSEIFEDFNPKAELAARADTTRGSFIIGLRLLEPTGQQSVRIHWRAVLEQGSSKQAIGEQKLAIRPDKLELRIRESYYLEAVAENLSGATILWEVKSPEGGTVSRDGMYTAPNRPGVYEIQAWCQEVPGLRASLYVIVRE